jgi:hypothetical protein
MLLIVILWASTAHSPVIDTSVYRKNGLLKLEYCTIGACVNLSLKFSKAFC